jgi:hypothetical protein
MNEKYRGRGNDMGQMGQGRKVRAREMSKYNNKQGSQGYWEKVEIVQQLNNNNFPRLHVRPLLHPSFFGCTPPFPPPLLTEAAPVSKTVRVNKGWGIITRGT